MTSLAQTLVDHLKTVVAEKTTPFFVAIDGRGVVGKSTLAAAVASSLASFHGAAPGVTVIEGDQFYLGGSAATWDKRSAAEKADLVIDWRRQRTMLQALRADGRADWLGFDWHSEDWDNDQTVLASEPFHTVAAPIVLLEGAYSARPELHDLLDLKVLMETSTAIRRQRLLERGGEDYRDDWESRWSVAEEHYFGTVMPPDRFDVVLAERLA